MNGLNIISSLSESILIEETYVVSRYLKRDILMHKNDIERYGFSAKFTEEEMIALAMKHGCRIVVKNGKKGKWYLKGKGKSIQCLQNDLDCAPDKFRDGVYTLLLKY